MARLNEVTKCQNCLEEIKNILVAVGGQASRIIVLSGNIPVKRKAKLICTYILKAEKILEEKNGAK